MTKEILLPLIQEGLSTYKIAEILNLGNSTIIYWIKTLDLVNFYKEASAMKVFKLKINSKYSKSIIEDLAKNSNSLTEIIEKLGNVPRGRNYDTIRKYLYLHNIDISHFNNKRREGMSKTIPLESHLKLGTKIKSNDLKKLLYKENLKERVCEMCGQNEYWNGKKLSLILDHIDGISNNNELKNLRIVCPNCNATLDTHCGKNKRTITIDRKIKKELERIENNGKTIPEIQAAINRRKTIRPDLPTLLKDTKTLGFVKTGKKYNVSDNCIRKWIKSYNAL